MALEASELIVGGSGGVSVAPVGTPLPTTVDETLDTAFADLGYTSEDGATFRDSKEVRPSNVWQSFYPVRRSVQSRNSEVEFALKQFNSDTLQLGFGGGTVEDLGGGDFIYHPPAASERYEVSMVVDIFDGDEKWRIVIPAGEVTSNTETQFNRNEDAMIPITFGVNASGDDEPWYLASNSDALEAVGS